jgi:transcriptional regulator with XRE-family HTH domain
MPFKKTDVKKKIIDNCKEDPHFQKAWEESQEEYRLLGEIASLRKKQGLSQNAVAQNIGMKQQVLSRIEKRENSPTLRTICAVLKEIGYRLSIVPLNAATKSDAEGQADNIKGTFEKTSEAITDLKCSISLSSELYRTLTCKAKSADLMPSKYAEKAIEFYIGYIAPKMESKISFQKKFETTYYYKSPSACGDNKQSDAA